MKRQKETEITIFNAAKKVFFEKGYDGAKMKDIADECDVDTMLVHYYFKSKDNLFNLVFDEAISLLHEHIAKSLIYDEQDVFIKIRNTIRYFISFSQTNPQLPNFVLSEFHHSSPETKKRIGFIISSEKTLQIFSEQLKEEYEKGIIRQISSLHLILEILSLCIFPIMCKPVINEINRNISGEFQYEAHFEELEDFILNAIKR